MCESAPEAGALFAFSPFTAAASDAGSNRTEAAAHHVAKSLRLMSVTTHHAPWFQLPPECTVGTRLCAALPATEVSLSA